MKSKKIKSKLVLNKKTVADLNNRQLGDIKGGMLGDTILLSVNTNCIECAGTGVTCPTCLTGDLRGECCANSGYVTCDTCMETNCSGACC